MINDYGIYIHVVPFNLIFVWGVSSPLKNKNKDINNQSYLMLWQTTPMLNIIKPNQKYLNPPPLINNDMQTTSTIWQFFVRFTANLMKSSTMSTLTLITDNGVYLDQMASNHTKIAFILFSDKSRRHAYTCLLLTWSFI